MKETAIVEAVDRLAQSLSRQGVRLGIGDDAAILDPLPTGEQLVVCQDTLNAGVHFEEDAPASDIGFKSLAVNLSDLAAMGAEPRWAMMSLSLPSVEPEWLDAFLCGFGELAGEHQLALIGGDTTRGALSVSVVAAGSVPTGAALVRGRCEAGDQLWISGSVGDAGLALEGVDHPELVGRLRRPSPRISLGMALRRIATACIDLSDGLRSDLPRLLGPRGAAVQLEELPASDALASLAAGEARWRPMVVGGDDYELCFTAPADKADAVVAASASTGVPVSCVGRVEREGRIRYLRADGSEMDPAGLDGFEHFR